MGVEVCFDMAEINKAYLSEFILKYMNVYQLKIRQENMQ